jgi:AGZA family xanthine/uracil permease-like MFS transporter
MLNYLDRYFGVTLAGSSLPREARAALTTFLAMSYILIVNPQILSQAIVLADGENASRQLMAATAIAAAIGCFIMGVFARYPIAVAPGMGLNAFFVFSVVLGRGVSWKVALGAVFVSGIVFLMLSLSGFREAVINSIPLSLKRAVGAGIGLFLAVIGLTSSGLIVANSTTLTTIGDLLTSAPLLMILGLISAAVLSVKRIPGALLISISVVTILAISLNLPVYNGKVFEGSLATIVSLPELPWDLLGAMDVKGALDISMLPVVFTFLFVAFFDTAGTLIALCDKSGLSDSEGRIPRAAQVFTTDALATSIGAVLGTSTTTAYIESATGIEDGGKTGLVAVVVGILFLVSLFFWPLFSLVPSVATAPALILLGAAMMESSVKINWRDYSEGVPAFLTIILMPLTWSISIGISVGIISSVLIRVFSGKFREVSLTMYVLAIVLTIKMALG